MLVVRGDHAPMPALFKSTLDFFDCSSFRQSSLGQIGIAVDPNVDFSEQSHVIKDKVMLIRSSNKNAFAVSQMCFDVEKLSKWIYAFFSSDLNLPLRVGIVGIFHYHSL